MHRNFKGLLDWFPELSPVKRESTTPPPPPPPPPPDYYTTLHSPEVKFSSSFSIDSILKKDLSPSGLMCHKASPPRSEEKSSGSVKVEQQDPRWWRTPRSVGQKMKFSWDSSPVDTDHGLSPRPAKRRCVSPLSQQERFNKCKTYMAMIAFVLQDSPGNMLTFSQVRRNIQSCQSFKFKIHLILNVVKYLSSFSNITSCIFCFF